MAAVALSAWLQSFCQAASDASARTIDGNEWQDMSRMSLGREATRASFAPFPDEKSALEILPWKSKRQITLDSDGDWKFKWSKDPASRPVGFERPGYDVSGWETIKVPCSRQAYGANGKGGWGTALYSSAKYPFVCNPPQVMDDPPVMRKRFPYSRSVAYTLAAPVNETPSERNILRLAFLFCPPTEAK